MKVIDSHIHILSLANQEHLKWKPGHPLHKNNRLEDYYSAITNESIEIDGIVAVEFDPPANMDSLEGLQAAIEEYKYFGRIVTGTLGENEGSNEYSHKLWGFVPWAPIPKGKEFLALYINLLKKESFFPYIKGFRYLLQDKPQKVMLQPAFKESLQYLADEGFAFDWGIDLHNGGKWQFEETIKLVTEIPQLRYIINHFAKPTYDLQDLAYWQDKMAQIYELTPNSYMKFSGGYSEISKEVNGDIDAVVDLVYPWAKISFDLWGVDRMMWASNWPVCEMFRPGVVDSWFDVTQKICDKLGLTEDDRRKVYYENAKKAYNL